MYKRDAYPGKPGILFYYDGVDRGQPWPSEAPSGISMAEGYVKVVPATFYAPGSSEKHHLTRDETIYLAGMSVGLPFETMAERYPFLFRKGDMTTARMRDKLGIADSDKKSLIGHGFYHGIYDVIQPALLTGINPNHRQTIVDINRLAGTGNTIDQAGALIGKKPAYLSEITKDALNDLKLGFVTTRPNALLMAIGMGKLLLNPYTDVNSITQLPALTPDETETAFPTKTLSVHPDPLDASTVIRVSGQHPRDDWPDWKRGKIESFTYRDATFDIGDTEKAGLNSLELATWVHRCVGMDVCSITDTLASRHIFNSATQKIANQTVDIEMKPIRRSLFITSIAKAREQSLIIPRNTQPRNLMTRVSDAKLLLDTADLVTLYDTDRDVVTGLRERGHNVSIKYGVSDLKYALGITHIGQLILLAEAVRHTITQSS